MTQEATARAPETREVLLIVSEVKELNGGMERVTLTPQYNVALGDKNQLLTSGSRTMEPWVFHVPQANSIFRQGNPYRISIELFKTT